MPNRRRVRRGDFLVDEQDIEQAEEAFSERSHRSRSLDKALRAPITTDVEVWERNQRGLDFPGVDTPTAEPRHAVEDFPLPGERAEMARGGPPALNEQEAELPLDEIARIEDEQLRDLKRGLDFDF